LAQVEFNLDFGLVGLSAVQAANLPG